MERLIRVKAILHDWDDTVVRTFLPMVNYFQQFAREQNLPSPNIEKVKALWHQSRRGIIAGLWPDLDANQLEEFFIKSVQSVFCPRPFEGVVGTINSLKDAGFALGVVSSAPRQSIMTCLSHYPILDNNSHLFIHAAEDLDGIRKPDPRVFDKAFLQLKPLGIGEDQAVYVGDGVNDYLAARQRGLSFVATTSGFTKREEFLALGLEEEMIVDSFNKLPAILGII